MTKDKNLPHMSGVSEWTGPYESDAEALDATRRAVAEVIGADPETWPDHKNAPLAIAAAMALSSPAPETGDSPTCQDCNGHNPVWFAPNEIWNRVMGGENATDDPGGIVCVQCFIRRAEAAGIIPTAWVLSPEVLPTPDAAKEQLRSIVDRNPEDFADGYGDTAEELEVVGFGEEYGSEVVTVSLRAGRHYKVPLVRQSDALAIIERLRAENERLTLERDGLVAGVSSIVNCQSSLTRSQMREAAKDLLDEHGLKVAYQGDQSPFVIRAEAAEARIHELEQMVNDEEANHQDTALRLRNAEARLAEAAEAIKSLLEAADQGRTVERGAGGMTIEAQLRRSVINGVPAWPFEEARTFLQSLGKEG